VTGRVRAENRAGSSAAGSSAASRGSRPLRVLHVTFDLDRGGTETWLMEVFRRIDPARFQMDFLVHTPEKGAFEDEVLARGGRVLHSVRPPRFWEYARQLKSMLRDGGYDVVHTHVTYAGLVLRIAREAGVPVRIAHGHNDAGVYRSGGVVRSAAVRWTNRWLARDATLGLGCSRSAAAALFGDAWESGGRFGVCYCGIDTTAFNATAAAAASADTRSMRAQLGIPEDAPVVAHIGRFDERKNQPFVVDIAAELARREPSARVLLIGDGPLRPEIERRVRERGLGSQVMLLGVRSDVPRLLMDVVDAVLLPSLYEGIPLTGMETQAAGRPLVLSDSISTELDVVPTLLTRVPLSASADTWADAVRAAIGSSGTIDREACLRAVRASPFAIENSVEQLERYYLESSG
jgi:glycosyltransferase involved in cell wall biosynthesis